MCPHLLLLMVTKRVIQLEIIHIEPGPDKRVLQGPELSHTAYSLVLGAGGVGHAGVQRVNGDGRAVLGRHQKTEGQQAQAHTRTCWAQETTAQCPRETGPVRPAPYL